MPKKKIQKMKPSSAILPARYAGSASPSVVHRRIKTEPIREDKSTEVNNVTNQNNELENTIYSDEDTLSTPRSEEGTLTSDEVDQEIYSDSGVLKIWNCVFKIQDEAAGSDQDNYETLSDNSKKEAYSQVTVKQKLDILHNDKKLYRSEILDENEECNSSSHKKVLNLEKSRLLNTTTALKNPNNSIPSDVIIKKEVSVPINDKLQTLSIDISDKSSSTKNVVNTLSSDVIIEKEVELSDDINDLEIIFTNLPEQYIKNEAIIQNSVVEDSCSLNKTLIYNNLENPQNYLSNKAMAVTKCSNHGSGKLSNFDLPSVNGTNNLNSQETSSSVSNSYSHCSKSYLQISPTPPTSEKSVLINQTFQISPNHMQLSLNCNSIINTLENAGNVNNKNKSKIVLPDYIANNELTETETDIYLYGSSEAIGFNAAISQTSDLHSHRKVTANCNLDDHTVSELFSLEKSLITELRAKVCETDISCQDDSLHKNGTEVCNVDFIEYSKEFLNFSKNDIIKCLNYLNSTCHRKEYTDTFYYFFKNENQSSLQTTDEEMENTPGTKHLSLKKSNIVEDSSVANVLPVSIQSSQEINVIQSNSAPVVEKSLSNNINVTKNDESGLRCSNLKIDDQEENSELLSVLEEKSKIECDNTKAQNETEFPFIDDNEHDDNLIRFNRIMSGVVSMCEAERMKEYIKFVSVQSDENLQKMNKTSTCLVEKSTSFTNSMTPGTENAVAHFNSDICSEKRNRLSIPSTEELKKIIEALPNIILSPESTSSLLNSPTNNMRMVKTEPPDTDKNNIGSLNVDKDKAEILSVDQDKTKPPNIDQDKTEPLNTDQDKTGPLSESNIKAILLNVDNIKDKPPNIAEVGTESLNGAIDKTESSNVKKNKTEPLNVNENVTQRLNINNDKIVPLNLNNVKMEPPDVAKNRAESLNIDEDTTGQLNIDNIKSEPPDIAEVETESLNGAIDKTESSIVKKNETAPLNVNENVTERLNINNDKNLLLNLNVKMELPDVDKDNAESLIIDEDKTGSLNICKDKSESLNIDKIIPEPPDIHIKAEPPDIHIKAEPLDIHIKAAPVNVNKIKTEPVDVNKIKTEPVDISKIKTEPPEIEEIVLEDEISFPDSFSVSKVQPAPALTPTFTIDDEIEVVVIKKKKRLQKTPDRKRKRDCKCECKCKQDNEIENTFVTNNHFNTVNISYGNNTFKAATEVHKTKITDSYQEKDSRSVFSKDIVVKIENTDEFSCGKSNDSIESDFSSKRTIYFQNSPNVTPSSKNRVKETKNLSNFDSFEKEKQNIENNSNENLIQQFGFNAVTNEENSVSPTLISNNSSKTCFGKRRTPCEVGKNKRAKTTVKDDVNCNISLCSRNAQKDLVNNSLTFHQKHTLTYAPVTVPSAANKKLGLKRLASRISTTATAVHPRVPVTAEHSHTLLRNNISSLGKNIQLFKPTDSCSKLETKLINSTAQNPLNVNKETRPKSAVCENNEDSSKTRLRSSKLRTSDFNDETNYAPLLDLRRRGRNSKSSVSPPDDLSTNVLEWNANWFIIQKNNATCFHIWQRYNSVKEVYEDESQYYNTYFPLHLLNVWLRITESWEKSPPCLDTTFENQVAKGTYVKICLSAELDVTDLYNWPKREDIVLCKIKNRSGNEDQLFGRICNVMVKDCNPSANNCKAQTVKKVRFELFCAEILNVAILAIVKIQILINLRIALLQYDALRNFNSTLKHIIFNPRKYKSLWKFISFSNTPNEKSVRNSIRSVIESMTSQKVTVVHTSLPSFGIISRLTTFLNENNRPVFIGIKNKAAFLELANNLRHFNPILAIKKKEVKLPEDLRQYTLEERSVLSQNIFNSSHVTLTLMTNIYLGDFTSVFDDQNLTCILHDAHLCTEVETTLLLYYGVKNLVLIGDEQAEIQMYPLLKLYNYDVSLFKRFCKVK